MLKNDLVVALRALWRHRGFSAINVVGLGLSMAVCLLIVLFLRDQRSYDRFHEGADRTYRVYSDFKSAVNADAHLYAMSPYKLAAVAREEVPDVEAVVGLRRGFGGEVEVNGDLLPLEGLYAEPSFFDVFSFRLAEGDPATALARPDGVVLSSAAARRLFGEGEAVGRALTFEGGGTYTVTGVFADEGVKTHLPLEAVVPMAAFLQSAEDRARVEGDWTGAIYSFYTYVRLAPGADAATVEARLSDVIRRHFPAHDDYALRGLHLQPITAINLGPVLDNQLAMVLPAVVGYVMTVLGLIVMLVACFNYVGLTTARALTRAKEVGVRKVVGAHRGQLVRQFLVEAFLVAGLALGVAVVLLAWLLPAFNALQLVHFFEADLRLDLAGDPGLYLVVLGFVAAVALAAGLYPALYLSRFEPASAVKGLAALRRLGGVRLQKGLAVVQFALAIVLVVTTVLLYRQASYLLNLDYGFEREHVVNVAMQGADYEVFRAEVLRSPAVAAVASAHLLPGVSGRADEWLRTPEMQDRVKGYTYLVDEHFIPTLGLNVVAGRGFERGRATDESGVVVNEEALRALGLGGPRDALGRPLVLGDSTEVEVIGVVADFQSNVAGVGLSPVVLQYAPEIARWAIVRAQPGEVDRAMADLAAAWAALDQPRPLQAEPYPVQIANNPQALLVGDALRLVGFIAVLALVIAALGLLGLATYAAERRTKEVGIRKVLGARVSQLVGLLAWEFAVLLGLAVALAVPAAWLLGGVWLDLFAQRVGFGAGTLALGVGAVLALAFATVGVQAWRAANADPVRTLRYE